MPYARKKMVRRVPRRRLQSYTPKQKNALLRQAAQTVAGGYATLRSRGFTPKSASEYVRRGRRFPSMSSSSEAQDSGMQDYRKKSLTVGRKKKRASLVRKLNMTQVNTQMYCLYNYGAWNRGEGALQLASLQPGLAGTPVRQPIHLWDLTAVPQGTGAAIRHPAVFYDCVFTNETSTGVVGWTTHVNNASTAATGQDQAGTANNINYNPTLVYTTTQRDQILNGNESGPGATSFLEKVHASLVLNGPQQRATKWCIQLVQLSDEVSPGVDQNTSTVATAFWQAMAKPYGYSPLETGPRRELAKHYKVLKTMVYNMDSPENSEDHLTARMLHVDFTMFLNRKLNYKWNHVNDLVNINAADTPRETLVTNFATHVHPKARVYLMIRALCTYQGPSVAYSNTIYPSYDIKLDLTHKSMD